MRLVTTIVVGLDGSPGSQRAARWVADHGPGLDAKVIAVFVEPRVELWEIAALQVDSGPVVASIREHLDGPWTDPLRAAGLAVTTRFLRGNPAIELCKIAVARRADLLVVGANSHSTAHDLLGGTAHKIITHAKVPVLLVPKPAAGTKKKPTARAGTAKQQR